VLSSTGWGLRNFKWLLNALGFYFRYTFWQSCKLLSHVFNTTKYLRKCVRIRAISLWFFLSSMTIWLWARWRPMSFPRRFVRLRHSAEREKTLRKTTKLTCVSEHKEKSRWSTRGRSIYTYEGSCDLGFSFVYFRYCTESVKLWANAQEWQALPFVFPYISIGVCEI
jgi:hypothetical protein